MTAQTKSETGWSDTFTDATYQYDFRIASDSGDATNWAGLSVRKAAAADATTSSGYLMIFRNNGQIVVSKPGATLRTVNTGLSFATMTHVCVESAGPRLSVHVGTETTPRLIASDSTHSSGYAGLAVNRTQSYFDTLTIDRRWLDVFDDAATWTAPCGTWAASGGAYVGNEGRTTVTGKTWSDAAINVDLRITDNKGNPLNWAGAQLRKSAQSDQFMNSGYLVYLRSNGQLCVYKAGVGDLSCAASGTNPSVTTHLKVVAAGPQIRAYVSGSTTPLVEVTDNTFSSGYVGLSTSGSVAAFDNFSVSATPISASRLTGNQVFRYTVLQAGAATQGPGIGWSYSPFSDGQWEVGAKETLTAVKALMDPVRSAIIGTMPSNSYPVVDGQKISTLPHGVVATRKTDDSKEYIHVLNPPTGATLQLPPPADGKTFSSARLLIDGSPVSMTQDATGVALTLPSGQAWSSVDTVIELTTPSLGAGQFGGSNYLLTNIQRAYVLRGTGNASTGTATGFNVAAVPSASAGVKDRWTLSYLGNDRYKIVNQYRNQMLRMAQDDYGGTSALSSVAMVANGSPTTPDQWIVQPYATGGVRLVSVGFGRPLHSAGDPYTGSTTVLSICGVPITFNTAEDLWTFGY